MLACGTPGVFIVAEMKLSYGLINVCMILASSLYQSEVCFMYRTAILIFLDRLVLFI